MRNAIVALAVLVGILAGFYVGDKVGQNNVSAAASTSNRSSQRGNSSSGGFLPGRGTLASVCPTPGSTPAAGTQALLRGTVTKLTATSMTVTNQQCSVTVTFASSTTVQKQTTGAVSDLANNQTVTVTGTRAADGSLTAVTIQIGAAGGGFTRPGAGSTSSPGPGG